MGKHTNYCTSNTRKPGKFMETVLWFWVIKTR